MTIAYALLRDKLLRLYPALEGESGDKGLDKSEGQGKDGGSAIDKGNKEEGEDKDKSKDSDNDSAKDEDKGWIPTSCHAAIRVVPPRTQLGD